MPRPNPTSARETIIGVSGRLVAAALSVAATSVSPKMFALSLETNDNADGVAGIVAVGLRVGVGVFVGVGVLIGVGVGVSVGVGVAVGPGVEVGAGVGVAVGIATEIFTVGVTLEYEHPAANLCALSIYVPGLIPVSSPIFALNVATVAALETLKYPLQSPLRGRICTQSPALFCI